MSIQSSSTWRGLWPLWLDHHFSPSSKDGGPHAVVEGMCCQAEELVAAVSAQAVDEQRQVHSHHSLTQQHVEPRLVLLPRRHQEGNQRRHTCRHTTWRLTSRLNCILLKTPPFKSNIAETVSWWRDLSVFLLPSQRPWGAYFRTPSGPLYKHRLAALVSLCLYIPIQSRHWCSFTVNLLFDAAPIKKKE